MPSVPIAFEVHSGDESEAMFYFGAQNYFLAGRNICNGVVVERLAEWIGRIMRKTQIGTSGWTTGADESDNGIKSEKFGKGFARL